MKLKLSGEIALLAATFVAAVGWIASKSVIVEVAGSTFIGFRFFIAGLVLLPLCYKELRRTAPRVLGQALAVGLILGISIQIWIYAISISDSLGEGAFIASIAILLAPLVAWPLLKQRPGRAFWVALPFAILGVALLSLTSGWQVASSQLYFLLSALLLSVHFTFNKYLSVKLSALSAVCLQLFSIGSFGILWSAVTQQSWQLPTMTETWLWFGVSVLLATSLRYVLQTVGQKHTNTATAAIIMVLEPVWTLLLSMLYFGEALPPQKLLGCSVILVSLILYRRYPAN